MLIHVKIDHGPPQLPKSISAHPCVCTSLRVHVMSHAPAPPPSPRACGMYPVSQQQQQVLDAVHYLGPGAKCYVRELTDSPRAGPGVWAVVSPASSGTPWGTKIFIFGCLTQLPVLMHLCKVSSRCRVFASPGRRLVPGCELV